MDGILSCFLIPRCHPSKMALSSDNSRMWSWTLMCLWLGNHSLWFTGREADALSSILTHEEEDGSFQLRTISLEPHRVHGEYAWRSRHWSSKPTQFHGGQEQPVLLAWAASGPPGSSQWLDYPRGIQVTVWAPGMLLLSSFSFWEEPLEVADHPTLCTLPPTDLRVM